MPGRLIAWLAVVSACQWGCTSTQRQPAAEAPGHPSLAAGPIDHHMHPRRQPLPPDVLADCAARAVTNCPAPAGFDELGLIAVLDSARMAGGVVLSRSFAATLRRPGDTTAVDNAAITASIRETNEWVAAGVARFPSRLVGFLGVDPLHASFGAAEVQRFIEEVLPAAPDIPIQIAHLGGWGAGYTASTAAALETFATHIAGDDPRTGHIQFDISAAVQRNTTPAEAARLVATMRDVGLDRFLFASDFPGFTPQVMWTIIAERLPLTTAEFEVLRLNRAAYLRRRGQRLAQRARCVRATVHIATVVHECDEGASACSR